MKLNISWRKPERFGEYDVGLVAHVESWTVSGQIVIKEAHPGAIRDYEAQLYVIDFDETSPVVVNHAVKWVSSKFEAMGIANKMIAAYIQSISGMDIEVD